MAQNPAKEVAPRDSFQHGLDKCKSFATVSLMKAMLKERGMRLRRGTREHDQGLCSLLLMVLTDDCDPVGKRRRSELGQEFQHGLIRHGDVAMGV